MRVLKAFAPILKQLLKPGEEILLAVRGCSPMSFLEQITTGAFIVYLRRCVLVFTNKRILHFPSTIRFSPRKSVAQVIYGDIEGFKLSGFLSRVFTVKYKSGKKENFHYLTPREMKKLKTLLPSLVQGGQPSEVRERHHLCPRCQTPLQRDRFSCPHCHLRFKDRQEATRWSLLYPGGGYFYTRHPFLGIGDAIGEAALFIILIAALVDIFTGTPDPGGWVILAVIGVTLFFEKAITVYHARHYVDEYIPLEENFVPVTITAPYR